MAYGDNVQTPNFANAIGNTPAERWRFSTLNDMLMSIDLAGIDYNDSIMDTMEGQQAMRIFTDVMYEVESEGWEYNTFDGVAVTLDANGEYKFNYTDADADTDIQPFVFSLVGSTDDMFVSMDGQVKNRSFTEPKVLGTPDSEITFNQVIIEAWADMHFSLAQYVSAMAVNRYQILMIGDATPARFSAEDVRIKYVNARRDEIRSGKYNILNSTFGQEVNRG